MPETASTRDVLLRVINAVHDADTLEGALRGITLALQSPFATWHASMWRHRTDADQLDVIDAWSLTESVFDTGVEVSTTITRPLKELLNRVGSGQVFTAELDSGGKSLLDALMREEGVAGLAAIPLSHDEDEVLFLALGSSIGKGFDTVSPEVLLLIGSSAAPRLLKLAATPQL